MKKLFKIAYLITAFLAVFTICTPAYAADRFSVIEIHPDPIQNRYFFIHGSDTLPKHAWSLGAFTLYYNQVFNIDWRTTVISRRGRTVTNQRGGIEHLFYQYYYGAFGITDRLSIMFDMPVFWYYNYAYTTTANPTFQWHHLEPGDLRFSAKINALKLADYPVGLSFITSISAPTGNDRHFLGDEGATGEFGLIAEARPADKLHLAFNASFQTRRDVNINDISFRDYLKFGLGANYKVSRNLGLIAELEAHTAANNAFGSKRTTPAETRMGVRWFPGGGKWVLGAGGSMGIIYGKGMPRYAGFINVGYSSKRRKDKPKIKHVKKIDEHIFGLVYFGFDKTDLNEDDITALEDFVDELSQADGEIEKLILEVRGWTDPIGPVQYNKLLSLKRAKAVADYIEDAFARRGKDVTVKTLGIGESWWVPKREARRADVVIGSQK